MSYALKKIPVVMMVLWLIAIGHVYGDEGNSSFEECGECCLCEPECCGEWFISADLLYLRAYQGGLDECFPNEDFDYQSSYGDYITKFKGKGRDPHFNWDAGFRIGAGYQFACDWFIAAFWTDFHSHASEHHRNDYGLRNAHKRRWNLDFDVVDVIAGYGFDVGSCFTLRPFLGLRGAWIDQKIHTDFESKAESSETFDSYFSSYRSASRFNLSRAHNKEQFWGVGPLFGVEGDWDLGCGFNAYGYISAAALYGHFHIRLNDRDDFDYCNVRRHLDACQAVVDAGLGIRWLTCFCGKIVWLQAGLEHHTYFNQNRFGKYGDLCLDGANFSAGIEF